MKIRKNIIFALLIALLVPTILFAALPDRGRSDLVEPADGESFTMGFELFEKDRYKGAAPYFYTYINEHSPGDDDYDWAEFFLGICLKKLGLSHASVEVLSHLVKRKPDPKIVTYSLELFEQVSRDGAFDKDLLVQEVIAGQEYGFVDKKVSDFIHYYQGVYDWENGFLEWGNNHFNKIRPETYYYNKYLYKKALLYLYEDNIDDSIILLKDILTGKGLNEKLKSEVRQSLARLLYEKGDFEASIKVYQEIKSPMAQQAYNLLERGWSQFRKGNMEKAMGLLYAYSAPGFNKYFTPEYYLLKSLIYKERCHYNKALAVVFEFRKRYGESLKNIYNRMPASTDTGLLNVLLTKENIKNNWDFIGLLEKEQEMVLFDDKSLDAYIKRVYRLQLDESLKKLKQLVEVEYENIADKLLQYEEKASLMEYEIGIDMSQRVYQFHYDERDLAKNEINAKQVAVYSFQGEYWNDELDDYRVNLPDKCENMEEWDIFFK